MLKKIVVLTGPTGVGKTELSIKLAKKFNGEIINCDASQVYKHLDIGTAKISLAETQGIKHHLIDIKEPDEEFSIKDFQTLARIKIDEITLNSKLPFLVGGSGLYINATLNDYQLDGPSRSEEFEDQFSSYSNLVLHELLQNKDHALAEAIHPNNRRRVLRALQMLAEDLTINNNDDQLLFDALVISFNTDRDILYSRINNRTEIMMSNGWLQESEELLKMGYNLRELKALGYGDIKDYFDGYISYEQLLDTIRQKTRRYAKRQITWNKNKLNSIFININYENINETVDEASLLIDKFLKD